MASKIANKIFNSTKSRPVKMPKETPLGSPGYDNVREDLEKTKSLREGTITKTPTEDIDIANKKYVDDNVGAGTWTDTSTNTGTNKTLDDFSNRIESDEVHIQIRNESGSPMSKGDLVYISGYSVGQNKPLVTLTDANSSATMPAIGMINDGDIANNADGHLTNFGRVFNVNTSAFSVGDEAYVSTTPGELSTRPAGQTDEVQAIGIILRSHASNGIIQIMGAGRTNDIPNDMDNATDLQNVGTNAHSVIDTHLANTTNPHSVDASDVSLGNVTNVATDDTAYNATTWNTNTDSATKNAIRDKVETMDTTASSNTTHRGLTNDPHNVTASQVGLGSVSDVGTDNTDYNATTWNNNLDSATKNVIRDKIETMDTAITSNTSASHAESHDIASHSDTTATGAELDTLTGGGDTTLHDHAGISENTTHRSSDGSDHADVVTNTAKVSFTKSEIKGVINHGGTAGTGRPTGFDSVEWIGTVEPTNAANDDTWIDTT